MAKSFSWHKISKDGLEKTEGFLRSREIFCVGACSRFISADFSHIWTYNDENQDIAAFLLHSRSSLFPIFTGSRIIPMPRFLGRLLKKVDVYSIQGLCEDIKILEKGIKENGLAAADTINYDLMTLDKPPSAGCFLKGPPELILRPPVHGDKEELFRLHSAYEQEEVIPRHGHFNPAASRKTLEGLLRAEKMHVAVLGRRIVGKINTNAKSFTRYQIGGVYVLPEFRGRGIAVKMSAVFIKELIMSGCGINLFVKKHNAPARNLYSRLGFTALGDYRINYY